MRRGGRKDGEEGGKQRVLVAPRGEGPEQLTSASVCSVLRWGKRSARLAELVLPPQGGLEAWREWSMAPSPHITGGPDGKPGRNSSSLGGHNTRLV